MENAADGARAGEPVDASVTTTIVRRVLRGCDEEFAPADASRDLFANGLASTTWEQLDGKLRESKVAGEERRDLTSWLIIAALFLLPVDVALRRVMTR